MRKQFVERLPHNNQVLVTCRVDEYKGLEDSVGLNLNGYSLLKPLNGSQIIAYLEHDLNLQSTVSSDPSLLSDLDTPLVLNLFTAAFRARKVEHGEVEPDWASDPTELRTQIISEYVSARYSHEQRKLQLVTGLKMPFSLEEITMYLGQLSIKHSSPNALVKDQYYFDDFTRFLDSPRAKELIKLLLTMKLLLRSLPTMSNRLGLDEFVSRFERESSSDRILTVFSFYDRTWSVSFLHPIVERYFLHSYVDQVSQLTEETGGSQRIHFGSALISADDPRGVDLLIAALADDSPYLPDYSKSEGAAKEGWDVFRFAMVGVPYVPDSSVSETAELQLIENESISIDRLKSAAQNSEDYRIRGRSIVTLAKLQRPPGIAFFAEGSEDESAIVRAYVAESIGVVSLRARARLSNLESTNSNWPAKAFGALSKMMRCDDDPDVHANVAMAIFHVYPRSKRREAGFRELVKRLRVDDKNGLESVVGILRDSSGSDAVKKAMGSAIDSDVREQVAQQLKTIFQNELDTALENNSRHLSFHVEHTIRAMRYISSPQIEQLLLGLLEHEYGSIAWLACESLGLMQSFAAVDSLISLIEDNYLHNCAAWSLGHIGTTKATYPLIRHLRAVRLARMAALGQDNSVASVATDFECMIIKSRGRIKDKRAAKSLTTYLADDSSPDFLLNVITHDFAGYEGIRTVSDLARRALTSIESR